MGRKKSKDLEAQDRIDELEAALAQASSQLKKSEARVLRSERKAEDERLEKESVLEHAKARESRAEERMKRLTALQAEQQTREDQQSLIEESGAYEEPIQQEPGTAADIERMCRLFFVY